LDLDFQLVRFSVIPIDHTSLALLLLYRGRKNSSRETIKNIPTADSSLHDDKFVQENLGLYSVSQGEGSNENFTEFLMQMKSEGNGFFPPSSETECHDMELFHRRQIQSVGQIH